MLFAENLGVSNVKRCKITILKSLRNTCFINYYSFINFIKEKLIKIYKYLGVLIVQRCKNIIFKKKQFNVLHLHLDYYTFGLLHLWTIKTPTCRRDISHKVTVTKVILNDRWCKTLTSRRDIIRNVTVIKVI
jgi:hypothetical protein